MKNEASLHRLRPIEQRRRQSIASLIVGVLILACGVGIFIGWAYDIPILQTSLVNGRIANPWELVSVFLFAFGYITYGITKKHYFLRIASLCAAMIALCALVLPPWFDAVFFAEKIHRIGQAAYFSYFSAFCIILVALLEHAIYKKWTRVTPVALVLLSSIILVNFYSKFYLTAFLNEVFPELLMTLAMAAVFTLAVCHMFYTLRLQATKIVVESVARVGVVVFLIVIAIQIAGYFSWNATVTYNSQDVTDEFGRATDTAVQPVKDVIERQKIILAGYQSFFGSRASISQQDFVAYSDVVRESQPLDIAAVQYIEPAHSKSTYKAVVMTSAQPHFVDSRQLSVDFAQKALQLNEVSVYYSELEHSTQDSYLIFVTPVRYKGATQKGAVIAYVTLDSVIKKFAQAYNPDVRLHVRVTTADRKRVLYDKGDTRVKSRQKMTNIIEVGDHNTALLSVVVEAPKDLGLTTLQIYLPLLITIFTQILSVLMVAILLLSARARARAEDIIASATSELEQERNYALQLHRKDEAIIAGIAEGLAVIDRHGRVQLINAAGREILGLPSEQPLGVHFETLLGAYEANGKPIPTSRRPIEIALTKGKTVSKTIYYSHKSGRIFPAQVRVSPIVQNDEIIGVIELFRDVTKDFELDKAKSEFVALASHQLRTPLSAVNWFGEMLLEGDAGKLNKTQHEYVNEIYQGNKRMISLINDLLNVSRMELGKLVNEPVKLDAKVVVESVRKELEMDAAAREIRMKVALQDHLPTLFADEKMVRIIIQNLMSNAVKYTSDKGSVEVVLRKATDADLVHHVRATHKNFLFFSVKDTGYGIPKTQQEKIFQKLFRADNVRKLDVEGTGLGLYMAKQVAETLGGYIWFESIESIGTTFMVLLPIDAAKSQH